MDPITGAVVIAGLRYVGPPSAELIRDFLGRVLAPAGDALGQAIAHPIVEWQKRRVERATQLVGRAAVIVNEMGQEPQSVPGRIFWPVVERGSVEEDPDLSERWAALLANASTKNTTVLPAFVTILSELSPLEARLLSRIYGIATEIEHIHDHQTSLAASQFSRINDLEEEYKLSRVATWSGVDEPTVALLCDNLERLALFLLTAPESSQIVTIGTPKNCPAIEVWFCLYGRLFNSSSSSTGYHFLMNGPSAKASRMGCEGHVLDTRTLLAAVSAR